MDIHDDRGPPITYGCVCSGLSAPTLAAKPLGWKTKFFSEIEPFPRAILAHRYPDVPLHGDFTTIEGDTYGAVDLLVGGTPCQSFSVAGKRLGLDDPRGNLALEYVRLAERVHAKWLVFESVPGLLSSARGDDFAAFISAVTGHDYRAPATGWQNAGVAVGQPGRWGIAWRILDAKCFGTPMSRSRLFLVGVVGNWRSAAAVLLNPESLGPPQAPRLARKDIHGCLTTGNGTKRNFDGSTTLIRDANGYRVTTPLEWERMMGFPDGYTDIYRQDMLPLPGTEEHRDDRGRGQTFRSAPISRKVGTPDGPRYRAIGNSMAVPKVNWIFTRIDHVDRVMKGAA